MRSTMGAALLALSATVLHAPSASTMCFPMTCPDCNLTIDGQLNLAVIDRAAGTVTLVPNIRIVGDAESFALILPTPAVPELAPASLDTWTDLGRLTAPLNARNTRSGCGVETVTFDPASVDAVGGTFEDVIVIDQLEVGSFDVTVLSSDDPDALTDWLDANGFAVTAEHAAALSPYVDRGWVFTAMKLRDGVDPPGFGWNSNVDPVSVTFEADRLDVPFDLLGINRDASYTMVFIVVDDHRVTLPGFDTTYANRISSSESASIARFYPSLAPITKAGRMITRLERRFAGGDSMTGLVTVARAPNDDEFRLVLRGGVPLGWLGLVAAMAGVAAWRRRLRERG